MLSEVTENKKLILKLMIPLKYDEHYNGEVLWTVPYVYRWLKAVLTWVWAYVNFKPFINMIPQLEEQLVSARHTMTMLY